MSGSGFDACLCWVFDINLFSPNLCHAGRPSHLAASGQSVGPIGSSDTLAPSGHSAFGSVSPPWEETI